MRSPPRILIADDNAVNLDILRTRLASQGYEIVTAMDGDAAVDGAREHRPDLILLDVMMPKRDGFEVCRLLKADPALPFMPIILVTAKDDPRDIVAGLESGGDEYLTKPVDLAALMARVKSILRIKALHDTVQEQAARLQVQTAELAEWNRTLEQRVAEQLAELERMSRLKRFLAPHVAESVISAGEDRVLGSHRRDVAIVFCELRGFTAFAETSEPEEVMEVLREYHAAFGEIIRRFEGTLERFLGDGLMVLFNDPVPCPEPAARAVRMAVVMRDCAAGLAKQWRKHGHNLGFGVGIAQGYATLGKIGFEGRFDYAAVGTVANLADRLCAEAKAGQILISQRVLGAVEYLVETEPCGELLLNGLARPIPAHDVRRLKSTEPRRNCPSCGNEFSGALEFCPVCILRKALAGGVESGESSFEEAVKPTPEQAAQRFEHYELVTGEDGKPVELGRGAMGITYKAFDVDLHCPVTLKVISERYLGDESARLRFLREARAAASVRHQNVASVFHLGRSAGDYFYAMEFVEGETLDHLIKRSGRLDVKLALEIATQVDAGLAAVHEQNLVHRDIKPTNIMVSLKEERSVTAKIIDLGLAKAQDESASDAGISSPGAFAGTPEFASPEQFAGVGVDIRSDLYSLGVTLWEMVTGQTPFRGPAAEVMYHHQHTPLPLERLKDVPQPVVVLLEKLLEKDPVQRFRTPSELLNAIPTITGAIDTGRRITRKSFEKTPDAWPVVTRKPPARLGQFLSFILGRANVSPSNTQGGSQVRELRSPGSVPNKVSVARLPVTGSDVFGRDEDIAFLDNAWANQQVNIVTIVARAGAGKSTLVNHWLGRMAAENYRTAQLVFGWSFYRQGSGGATSSADEFLDATLTWFGDPDPRLGTAWEKGERLAKLITHCRTLLVLDGLEPLQNPPGPQEGRVTEPSLQALLRELATFNTGLCVITTRIPVADIADHERTSALRRDLEQLSSDAGAKLLRALGVNGDEDELRNASDEFSGHCLALTLLGSYLSDAYNGDIRRRQEVSERLAHDVRQGVPARKVIESYQTWVREGPELSSSPHVRPV
jgi:adenylate cyclase